MFSDRKVNILLIEDEDYDVRRIKNTLKPFQDYLILKKIVSTGEAALEALREERGKFDVVIMDFQIVGSLSGESLIKKIKEIDDIIQILVVTKMTVNIIDFEFANRLIEAGAMWYCTKYPGDIEEYIYQPTDFILSLFNAAERRYLAKEELKSRTKLDQNIQKNLEQKKILGNSEAIRRLRQDIDKAAESDATILITGASGTGKELVANHIHYQSRRRFENLVPINCGSIPQELIESELFGFEKGSFTGAQNKKPGLFELADHGTLFLDEIGELPLSAQVKLLRFLEDGEIEKIGRTKRVHVDVRIVAATNKNISDEIKSKKFREDLFYRLNVFPIWVPPLTERKEDILEIANYYLGKYARNSQRPEPEINEKALIILQEYDWPGNVRELQNVVQRLVLTEKSYIDEQSVREVLMSPHKSEDDSGLSYSGLLEKKQILTLREVENKFRAKYFRFVRENSSSDAEAARKLGLAPPNYYRMCKELGLK
ncbi:MAG: sigma-54-dependent Fis family transcriptional regulator [bacterium]|nr:MAG: sigma-54-dependent Fis family transcriptional regulator [bacterium]